MKANNRDTTGRSLNARRSIVKGKLSVERLSHFSCGACDQWWSVGDAPTIGTLWYCPRCGLKQRFSS